MSNKIDVICLMDGGKDCLTVGKIYTLKFGSVGRAFSDSDGDFNVKFGIYDNDKFIISGFTTVNDPDNINKNVFKIDGAKLRRFDALYGVTQDTIEYKDIKFICDDFMVPIKDIECIWEQENENYKNETWIELKSGNIIQSNVPVEEVIEAYKNTLIYFTI